LGLQEKSTDVLRALDKLAKVGAEAVATELANTAGATTTQIDDILHLAALAGSNDHVVTQLAPLLQGSPIGEQGLSELAEMTSALAAAGIPAERFQIDVS